jgi:hypothetical protein
MGNSAVASFGPLPLIIAVTGHRDLRKEDLSRLAAQVRNVITSLQRDYPNTPLILLSPLAEGADRLVARVALDLGVRLVSPLPFAKEHYEEDFESQASLVEFRALLAQADSWFELPLKLRDVSSLGDKDVRRQQYAYLGAYLVRHSHILLALWDGVDSPMLPGGTAAVVQYKLKGVREQDAPSRSLPAQPLNGSVYHLVTPRENNPDPQHAFALNKLFPPSERAEAVFTDHLRQMEEFNCDVLEGKTQFADE